MKPKLLSLYILNKNNSPIIQEEFDKDKLNLQDKEIVNIVETLEKFASELDDQLDSIVIDKFRYFHAIDDISGTKFILKTERDISEKKVFPILKKVKNIYINEFLGVIPDTQEESEAVNSIHQRIVSEIIEYESKLDSFMKSL